MALTKITPQLIQGPANPATEQLLGIDENGNTIWVESSNVTVSGSRVSGEVANAAYAATSGSSASTANAEYANTAGHAENSNVANTANTTLYAENSNLANTATFATSTGSANTANYAGTANTANYATNSDYANSSNLANTATYATSANTANTATRSDTADTAGTVTANAQSNITSLGTLVSLSVSGNATFDGVTTLGDIANIHITGGSDAQVLTTDGTGNLSWGTPPASYGDANVANYAGNINFVGANISLGNVSNLHVTGGSNGQYLKTDGSGNLSWGTVSTSSLTNGNSNVVVAANANVTVSSAGNTTLTVTGTGISVAGDAVIGNATANVTLGNGTITTTGSGNVNLGTSTLYANGSAYFLGASGQLSLGASATTMNITIGGGSQTGVITLGRSIANSSLLIANGNVASGNTKTISIGANGLVGSSTNIDIGNTSGNGNVTFGANTVIGISNTLTSTGNVALTGANVSLGNIANLHITGGTNAQYLQTDGNGTLTWATVSGGGGGGSNIANGTSNVSIATANGNISMGVGGTANVIAVANTGLFINGNLSINGSKLEGVSYTGAMLMVRRSGGQSIATGSTIQWNDTYYTTNDVTYQAATIFLKAGRTYKLTGQITVPSGASGGRVAYSWYNQTSAGYIGTTGGIMADNSGAAAMMAGTATAYITVTSDIQVDLRVTYSSGTYTVGGTAGGGGDQTGSTWATVEEVGAGRQYYFRDYINLRLGTSQAGFANATDVTNWVAESSSGGLALTSGTTVTLKAGKTYRMTLTMGASGFSTSTGGFAFAAPTFGANNTQVTNTVASAVVPANWASNEQYSPTQVNYYTPTVDTAIKVRGQVNSNGTTTILADYTRFSIEEVGASAITGNVTIGGGGTSTINGTLASTALTTADAGSVQRSVGYKTTVSGGYLTEAAIDTLRFRWTSNQPQIYSSGAITYVATATFVWGSTGYTYSVGATSISGATWNNLIPASPNFSSATPGGWVLITDTTNSRMYRANFQVTSFGSTAFISIERL